MAKEIEFLYKDNLVGYLYGRPVEDGHIKYEAYRGFGHIDMQEDLEKGILIECSLAQKELKKSKQTTIRPLWVFTVYSCPEYGVLNVSKQREKT